MPIPDSKPAIAEGRLLARFPFLPQASPWIAGLANKHGIDLDTLLEGEYGKGTIKGKATTSRKP